MPPFRNLVYSFLLILHISDIYCKECGIPNEPKTRVFDTIELYQGNKISFSPFGKNWKGSNVEFRFSSINRLSKNGFVSFDSDYIIKLSLNNKSIENIDNGAFSGLFCLHILELSENNISAISREMFSGLRRLKKLDLSGNQIMEISDVVFGLLSSLTNLNLSRNRIRTLHNLAFFNMTSLEVLNLEYNKLKNISPETTVHLGNLIDLNLASNKFVEVDPEKWLGLKSLINLNLANNSLSSFEPSFNFSFAALEKLNLSNNHLTDLNVKSLRKHLPKLNLLDINDNLWFCVELASIIHELTDSRIACEGRSNSLDSERNISCSPTKITYIPSTSTTVRPVVTFYTTKIPPRSAERSIDVAKVLYQNKEIIKSNEEIVRSIQQVESLVICFFVVVIILVVVEVSVRIGLCKNIFYRVCGRTDSYLHNDNIENMILLRN